MSSALIFGTGYGIAPWKIDKRTVQVMDRKSLSPNSKKLSYKTKDITFYDGPTLEWVDNYSYMYDWHNIRKESKQYHMIRKVLTGVEIRRNYPMADADRLDLALSRMTGDLTDYADVRRYIKEVNPNAVRTSTESNSWGFGAQSYIYATQSDPELRMFEVFEWWRPYDDALSVMVGDVPILPGGSIPIPFAHKEFPMLVVPFIKSPGEFEGIGLPQIMESPQTMLNTIKNQRIDSATLRIHTPFIVNPVANIDKNDLRIRPFGIIYSTDPNGVRELQFSDVKQSAYEEENLLKSDLRYASGVDDAAMGVAGGGSATETRHLRESTLERVRLFINHIGSALSDMMRWWLSMRGQFTTTKEELRIIGDDGVEQFILVSPDDYRGDYDYKAAVNPNIAGRDDVDKKQIMELFQMLQMVPGVDLDKLISKVVSYWGMGLNDIRAPQEKPNPMAQQPVGPDGQPIPQQPPDQSFMDQAPDLQSFLGGGGQPAQGNPEIASIIQAMGYSPEQPYDQASMPIDLLGSQGQLPPTVADNFNVAPGNPMGLNMGGKVNTTIPNNLRANNADRILAQAQSI